MRWRAAPTTLAIALLVALGAAGAYAQEVPGPPRCPTWMVGDTLRSAVVGRYYKVALLDIRAYPLTAAELPPGLALGRCHLLGTPRQAGTFQLELTTFNVPPSCTPDDHRRGGRMVKRVTLRILPAPPLESAAPEP
jgi:hypothetical protein